MQGVQLEIKMIKKKKPTVFSLIGSLGRSETKQQQNSKTPMHINHGGRHD